ncbi:MAG TPA: serine/threonine-protein kinase PknK, partial [Cyanophyceae cyanobacterium]
MSAIANYQIVSKIYESANSLVYRAIDQVSNRPIILKVLKKDYPTPSELTRYKQEYEITRSLKIDGVIKAYNLLPYESTLAMVLEDFGGQSLDMVMKSQTFELSDFLAIAIQIAKIIDKIHAANVIHKDINPSNIVFNTETRKIKIIDFGISTVFTRENPTIKNPNVLEGTLAYLSPEQTGRMNRSIDYSTDFYSLGATFYKLLTQRLLFETSDPLELVHCHIAKQPMPLHEVNPNIPRPLSNIVMKLLAKTSEERYQSALGLKADLEECLTQLQQTGQISEFPLARHDCSNRFQIPQKLYGRESEIETLLAAFKRIADYELIEEQRENEFNEKRPEMMLVVGYSGIGKSLLVQELYKPVTQQRGYFIAGKFDQFQRNIPYSAVVYALQSLVRQLLTEPETQLAHWREKLLAAFGMNGQVIIDVIPEVEQIVGTQPPVQSLEPTEAQNRFNTVFQNFMRVFCQRSHPLVIFLDDLQWADSASLRLIELMITDSYLNHLLLIGAYRDNEVSANHPTMLTIDRLKEKGAIVNRIILDPLNLEEITQLVAETLHSDQERVKPLAELVFQKTSGNPFFINEFLRTLYQENLLTFVRQEKIWQWDIAHIQSLGITENVVDLMIGKLRKLPRPTQKSMRLAACIGNNFDLNTLSIINQKSTIKTFKTLLPAIQLGLIQPVSELETTSDEPIESALVIKNYKFRHDRVQQAAYELIDDEQKKKVHLQIGQLLLTNISETERDGKIFTLVDHLNKGRELLESITEKIELSELNLKAGKKAKEATAYTASRDYLVLAKDEFPGNIWNERYEMALDLYKELAEVEYLNGNFQQSQSLLDIALQQAKTILDCTEFHFLRLMQYTLLGQYSDAIETGRIAVRSLEIDLPAENLQAALDAELADYRESLNGRAIASLYDHPEMEQPEKKAALKILTRIANAAWVLNPVLMYLIGTKIANLNIKYGHTQKSSIGYSMFGVISTHALHDYRSGYEYGALSMKLSNKYEDLSAKIVAIHLHANITMPWLRHIKNSEGVNTEAVDAGLQAGDLQIVGYTLVFNLYNQLYQGKNLDFLLKEIARCLLFNQETHNQWAINCTLAAKILIQNLSGSTKNQYCWAIQETDESDFLENCDVNKTLAASCFYHIFKAQILYLYGEPIDLVILEKLEKMFDYIPGNISIAHHNFYFSLTLIRLHSEAPIKEQNKYWKKLKLNQKQMKVWADNCPDNFLHSYLLVSAEMARISGKWQEAMELYDQAIESAKEHEFIQNEALANELAAKFWLARGKEEFAKIYLNKARQCYQIWGATRKVENLDRQYTQLLTSTASQNKSANPLTTSSQSSGEVLDLATVLKASQTISGEIILDKLLENLMNIMIENAGAQTGVLILDKDGKLLIEANSDATHN